jgi:integrase
MGHLFRPTATRPIPPGAEILDRDGERIARWRSARGGICTAIVKGDRISVPSPRFYARYKDGEGVTRVVPTGCKDESAARARLVELERRAELVRSGVLTAAQDAAADHKRTTITGHIDSYLAALKARGTTTKHQETVGRLLRAIIAGCRFRTLADIRREPVERWLAGPENAARSARTRNTYANSLKWFCNWCVDTERLVASPVARIEPFDENADRRRKPRALNADELQRLLDAARRRPLAEARLCNRGWRKNQPGARLRPETVLKLERLGRERALVYKTLVLTGLRLSELASIRVGDLVLDGPAPHVVLDPRNEKNRQGSQVSLRADLCRDLTAWIAERGGDLQRPLFSVSLNLVKVFNRDLRFAGIPKHDARGRTACVHSLRYSFGSLLASSEVPARVTQAAMRHSSIDLTMNVYTDPRLLDVQGALSVLPELALDHSGSVPATA